MKFNTKLSVPQDKAGKIDKEELRTMVSDIFGEVPATFDSCWNGSIPPNGSAMDPPHLIKFFYLTVKPNGFFHPSVYKPNYIETVPMIVSFLAETVKVQRKRIDPVIVSKFVKIKPLGKGGEGIVHLGTYDGQVKPALSCTPSLGFRV